MYKNGFGVSQDYKEAVKWYSKAIEQGNEEAKSNLAALQEKMLREEKMKGIEKLKTTGVFIENPQKDSYTFIDDADQKKYFAYPNVIEKVGELKGKRVRIHAQIKKSKNGKSMMIPYLQKFHRSRKPITLSQYIHCI